MSTAKIYGSGIHYPEGEGVDHYDNRLIHVQVDGDAIVLETCNVTGNHDDEDEGFGSAGVYIEIPVQYAEQLVAAITEAAGQIRRLT